MTMIVFILISSGDDDVDDDEKKRRGNFLNFKHYFSCKILIKILKKKLLKIQKLSIPCTTKKFEYFSSSSLNTILLTYSRRSLKMYVLLIIILPRVTLQF